MNITCEDYDFWQVPRAIAGLYVAASLLSLLVNFDLLILICKSKHMLASPKYWLVMGVSVAYVLQAAVPNTVLTAKWLTGNFSNDRLWKFCVVFNRYLGVGVATWGSLLVNLDYVVCMKSASYTRYYRSKAILVAMGFIWLPLISSVMGVSFTEEVTVVRTDVHQILLWMTFFVPLVCSFSCSAMVVVWRGSRKLQQLVTSNEDVSDPLDAGDCPLLPPSDHVTFLLLLVILYIPIAVSTYSPIGPLDCKPISDFLSGSTLLRDNAGCLTPLAWFLFKDLQLACRKCVDFKVSGRSRQGSLLESSEMNIYDNYPYCTRIQV